MSRVEAGEAVDALRGARVLGALRPLLVPRSPSNARDALLVALAVASVDDPQPLDTLSARVIEAAVGVAVTSVEQSQDDELATLLLASTVLALDGQLARLRQLSDLVADHAERLEVERPLLAAALRTCSLMAKDSSLERTVGVLDAALGISDDTDLARYPATRVNRLDALACAIVRRALATREPPDTERIIRDGDGLRWAVLDLGLVLARVRADLGLRSVVITANAQLDPEARERLDGYLRRHRIHTLMPAQADAVRSGLLSPSSRVVALPTSSGKTLLAELKIASTIVAGGGRAIYLAPYRLVARQVQRDLRPSLGRLGLSVQDLGSSFDSALDLTGDLVPSTDHISEDEARLPDVAIMTPERMDALLRAATADPGSLSAAGALFDSVRLLAVDESQLLGRYGRGARLELILTRFKARFPAVEVLALAAATVGVEDLGGWLGDPAPFVRDRRPTGTIEIAWTANGRLMLRRAGASPQRIGSLERSSKRLRDGARMALLLAGNVAPVLAVVPRRDYAEKLVAEARSLDPAASRMWRDSLNVDIRRRLAGAAEQATAVFGPNSSLAGHLQDGVAFHHAGVPPHLLRIIEDLARAGGLRLIASTTTVAEGADMPFRAVVIPYLNFQDGPLSPTLYRNIVGRAGRVGSAIEGLVVVLGTEAPTLKSHISKGLWVDDSVAQVKSRLPDVVGQIRTPADRVVQREFESQVLAWLGEGGAGTENQASAFAALTFAGTTPHGLNRVSQAAERALSELERRDFARAASPYKLTSSGERARLTGLSPASCFRLRRYLETSGTWVTSLVGASALNERAALQLALAALNGEELLEKTLWFRRSATSDGAKLSLMQSVMEAEGAVLGQDEGQPALLESEIEFLQNWILGKPYSDLASIMPVMKRGAFSSDSAEERAADAAEHCGRLAYPAAWCASAIRVLAPGGGDLPYWTRDAVEYGLPGETAVRLSSDLGVSREGSVLLQEAFPVPWDLAEDEILGLPAVELRELGLTTIDTERIERAR